MYVDLLEPLPKMLEMGKFDGRKRSKKKLACTTEAEEAFDELKGQFLHHFGLFLGNLDKRFVLLTAATYYAVGAVFEQVRCDGTHARVAF